MEPKKKSLIQRMTIPRKKTFSRLKSQRKTIDVKKLKHHKKKAHNTQLNHVNDILLHKYMGNSKSLSKSLKNVLNMDRKDDIFAAVKQLNEEQRQQLLLRACGFGPAIVFEVFIDHYESTALFECEPDSPITLAAEGGRCDILKLLLQHPLATKKQLSHAFTVAIACQRIEVVKMLLEKEWVKDPSENKNMGLVICSDQGNIEIATMLLQYQTVLNNLVSCNALDVATGQGHLELVNLYLKTAAALDNTKPRYGFNDNAIKICCENGSPDILEVLLTHGFDATVEDNFCFRAACVNGHEEIVQLLMENSGVDPSFDDNVAIGLASENGHVDVVRILMEDERVDPGACNNFALQIAAKFGHADVVEILLSDESVDPNVKESEILHHAVESGKYGVVAALIGDSRTIVQTDILESAQKKGNEEILAILLRHLSAQDLGFTFCL